MADRIRNGTKNQSVWPLTAQHQCWRIRFASDDGAVAALLKAFRYCEYY